MSALIQIRNVPEQTRRLLKSRAAARGESLNSYLLSVLEREASQPTVEEVLARAARRPWRLHVSSVEALHDARAEREQELGS